MTQKELEKKIKTLKPSQILDYMIKGLENPFTQIRMSTYGDVEKHKKQILCFGCAATNTLIKLCDMSKRDFIKIGFNQKNSIDWEGMSGKYDLDVKRFESAIDTLRKGIIPRYNRIISEIGFRNLVIPDNLISNVLVWLNSEDYKEHLSEYEYYAFLLKTNGF